MLTIIRLKNPFKPEQQEKEEVYVGGKETLKEILADDLSKGKKEVFLNGQNIEEKDYAKTYPQDGQFIVVMPNVGGDTFKSIFGMIAMVALAWATAGIAAGGWAGALGQGFAAGTLGAYLAAGAVMFIGGRLINSLFGMNQSANVESYKDTDTSPTYGWNLPTISSASGNIVGETYGECIPAGQLLVSHLSTENDKQYLNLLISGGNGEVDDISDIRIDNTPIRNFTDVEYETRKGTNTQSKIPFLNETPRDKDVSVTLEENVTVSRSTDLTRAKALSVTMSWPSGIYHMRDDGELESYSVRFTIEYRKANALTWTKQGDHVVTGNDTKEITREIKWNVPEEGKYDVRVTLTEGKSSTRYMSTTQWKLLTAWMPQNFVYPNRVLIGLKILATSQLSGGIPNITWRQKRNYVWVYDPNRESYVRKDATNPIWAAYDILHHCRYLDNPKTSRKEYVVFGIPHTCFDRYFDRWAASAAYADELVINNEGKREKRFTFNYYFDQEMRRYEAANRAANVAHSTILIRGNHFTVVTDMPQPISQIFNEGNIVQSSLKGKFAAKDDRAKAVEITYNDTENDFKNTQFCLRSPSFNQFNDSTAELKLYGVSRRTQAFREGIQALATNERQLQFIDLETDINGLTCEYGDVVGVASEVMNVSVASGRVDHVYKNGSIRLDKPILMEAGKTYGIYIHLKNDTLVKRTLVDNSDAKDKRIVTPSVAWDSGQIPEKFDDFSVGEIGKEVKPYRVVGIKTDGDLKVTLNLAEYDEAVYADDWDYTNYPDIDYTASTYLSDVVTSVSATPSYFVNNDGTVTANLQVSYTVRNALKMPDRYLITATDSQGQKIMVETPELEATVSNVKVGETYTILVQCVYNIARIGTHSTRVFVSGKSDAPGSISNLRLSLSRNYIHCAWNRSASKDVRYYSVYYGMDNAAIGSCTLYKTTNSNTCEIPAKEAGSYIVYVQAVDTSGNVSSAVFGTIDVTLPSGVQDLTAKINYTAYRTDEHYSITVNYRLPNDATSADVYLSQDSGVSYTYVGSHESNVTTKLLGINKTYRLKVQAKNNYYKCSDSNIKYIDVTISSQSPVPDTPQNFTVTKSNRKIVASWSKVSNVAIDYYELRLDTNPGNDTNLILRTQQRKAQITLNNRNAKVYCYAHSYAGKYSAPAEYQCNFPLLPAPATVKAVTKFRTVTVDVPLISNAEGVTIRVTSWELGLQQPAAYTDDRYSSENGQFAIQFDAADIYYIYACYYDNFGEGEWTTEPQIITIKPYFDPAWIEDGALSEAKFDKLVTDALKNARDSVQGLADCIAQINVNKDSITSIVTELGKDPDKCTYSAISQLQNGINLRVKTTDFTGQNIINQINLTPEGTTIDGKYLHVTGTTQFDDSVIVNKMLAANAVTADKMSVDSLSAISATLGTVSGGTIIGSTFRNKNNTFYIDQNGNIVGAKITGSSLEITSADLKVAGLQIRAVTFKKGSISNGGTIPLPSGYSASECIWWAVSNNNYFANIDGNRKVTFSYISNETKSNTVTVNLWVDGQNYSDTAWYSYVQSTIKTGGSGTYYVIGVKQIT